MLLLVIYLSGFGSFVETVQNQNVFPGRVRLAFSTSTFVSHCSQLLSTCRVAYDSTLPGESIHRGRIDREVGFRYSLSLRQAQPGQQRQVE